MVVESSTSTDQAPGPEASRTDPSISSCTMAASTAISRQRGEPAARRGARRMPAACDWRRRRRRAHPRVHGGLPAVLIALHSSLWPAHQQPDARGLCQKRGGCHTRHTGAAVQAGRLLAVQALAPGMWGRAGGGVASRQGRGLVGQHLVHVLLPCACETFGSSIGQAYGGVVKGARPTHSATRP